jgi:DNA repair protein RadC
MAKAHSTKPRQAQALPNFLVCERTGRYVARRALTEEQIIKAALKLLEARLFRERQPITSMDLAGRFLAAHFAGYEHEAFGLLLLDNRHSPIAYEELFRGSISEARVYPREVVKAVLAHNAAAVILAHNHPSGGTQPSGADRAITRQIAQALELVEVRTLDHLIIGGGKYCSLAALGLMKAAQADEDAPENGEACQPA